MNNKYKAAATFTIHRAAEMSKEGRKELAEWLRHQAKMLMKEGDNYSKRFTARYLYPNETF